MAPLDWAELRTYSSRSVCSCSSWRSNSATLRPASPMARLKSRAEFEAISWMGSNRLDLIMGSSLSARWRNRRRELRHELFEIRITSLNSNRFVHVLTQEFEHFGPLLDGEIHPGIGTAPIGPDRNQVAVLLISRIHLPEAIRQVELLTRCNLVHCTTDGSLHIHGRIQAILGQAARQHDVPVQNGARRIGDGIVLIIAFHQDRVERRDRADTAIAVAGALDQLRQSGEHRWRIALGRGRLADGQRDLALRLRKTRQ